MSTNQDFSPRAGRAVAVRSSFVRVVRVAMFMSVVASGVTRTALAQSGADEPERWEFRASSGALVPTGSARAVLKDAALSTAQLTYVARPFIAVTGTLGWARSRDRLSEGQPKLDAFLYDIGAEFRPTPQFTNTRFSVASFVGAGAGAHSYNYRSLDVDATHNAAAYATIGAETGFRRARLRLEVRDYVSGFKPLAGVGASRTQNDVVFMAAFRLAKRR